MSRLETHGLGAEWHRRLRLFLTNHGLLYTLSHLFEQALARKGYVSTDSDRGYLERNWDHDFYSRLLSISLSN